MPVKKINLKKILKVTFVTGLSLVILFSALNYFFPLPDKIEYSTIVTDNKHEIMHAFLTSDDKWRMKTELAEISPLLRRTIIQKEDKYFYHHPGINPVAIFRAFAKNIVRRQTTSGASTITMQVARVIEPKRRTLPNKAIEIFRAFQLEYAYTKDEILQLYLNLVPYGGNIEGVKSAALLYFNKSPDHLSLAEITALSIIPNRPSSLVIGKSNPLILKERNRWLRKFAEEKVFTTKDIQDALREPLTASRREVPQLLPQLSYKLKANGGNIINTSIDLNTQMKVERLVQDYVRILYLQNIRNAAVIVTDNSSHKIISYVGSANFKDTIDGGQVNGAAAIRQPGSTLKPLLYGLAIDAGLMTPQSLITDIPVNYLGYAPENYDKKFNGDVTLEYALEHSLNIPAVKTLKLTGKNLFVEKLADCNFEQIKKDQGKLGLSMILGGCGASLEELTGLYSSMATDGVYIKPAITENAPIPEGKRLLSKAATFMINDILSKVNRPDFPVNWQSTERMPKIAWKTGTSYGRRDAWSVGYNKKYTVGIWVGNFSGLGIPELSGANIATPLLFKIFNSIDYDSDEEWFQQPPECDTRIICAETGMIPVEGCKNLRMDYFIPLISSVSRCNNVQEVLVSFDDKLSYCKSCMPENGYKKKLFTIVAPEMQSYYMEHKIAYKSIPKHNPECEKIFNDGSPRITFPSENSEYFISKKFPEPLQLTCNVGADVTKVFWYINDKFYRSTLSGTKQFFIPGEGNVKISCTDDKGRNKDIWIRVRYADL